MSSHTLGAQMRGAADVPVAFSLEGRGDGRGRGVGKLQLLHAGHLSLRSRTGPPRASAEDTRKQGWGGWRQATARGSSHAFRNCTRLPWVPVIQCIHLPWSESRTLSGLRDGSTQHVRGKQFIFLPQLLTGGGGGGIKRH